MGGVAPTRINEPLIAVLVGLERCAELGVDQLDM
jgi:hypothetical protein